MRPLHMQPFGLRSHSTPCSPLAAGTPDLLLAQQDSSWSLREEIATGDTSSRTQAVFDVRGDPSNWLGGYVFIPSIVLIVFAIGMEFLIGCFRPEGVGPIAPCCSSDGQAAVGLCGDALFKDCNCARTHEVCITSTRQSRADRTDDCGVDCMRVCGFVPFIALHLASLVFGVLQAADTGPMFEFQVRGSAVNGTRSTSVTVTYTMSGRKGCLESESYALGSAGYATRDCFDIDSPRQLTLRPPGSTEQAAASDFSLTTMAAVAPIIQAANYSAMYRGLSGVIIIVCLLVFLVCNMRRGKAAAAFKWWGKLANALLLASVVISLVSALDFSSALDSIRRRPILAALRGAAIDEDDDYGIDLLGVTSPIAGGDFTFEPRYVDISSGSYGNFDSLVMGFSAAQLVMLLPVAVVGFCATFNGQGKFEEDTPSGPELLTSSAGAATHSSVASPASERAPPQSTTVNPYSQAAKPADSTDYGCLRVVSDASKRREYEQQAQELATMVRQVRSAGVAATVEKGLMRSQPKLVRKRTHELLSKPKQTSDGETSVQLLAALSASRPGAAASSAAPASSAPTKAGPPAPEEPSVPAFPGYPASAHTPTPSAPSKAPPLDQPEVPAFPGYPAAASAPLAYPSSGAMPPPASAPGGPGYPGAAGPAYPGMGGAAYPPPGAPAFPDHGGSAYPGMAAPPFPGMGAPAAAYPPSGPGAAHDSFGALPGHSHQSDSSGPPRPGPPGGPQFPDNFAL